MVDINKFKKEPKQKAKLEITPSDSMETTADTSIPTVENEELNLDKTKNTFSLDETNLSDEDIKQYVEYFESIGITKTRIFEVLDNILTRGEVNWNFNLLNKIPVTFRLRPSWVNDELVKVLDEFPSKTMVGFTEIISRYNLAGSLKVYNHTSINIKDKSELENALLFIGQLPYIVRAHLIKQLAIFDRLIAIATSDWALENFTLPQQEN